MAEEDSPIIVITMATSNQDSPNVTELSKGLNTDFSPQVQPEGTYRFALNAVDEAELGDSMFRSNEEGNELSENNSVTHLPDGAIPIGKCFIGNGDTVIFLVSKNEAISYIYLFNEDGTYTELVNDATSTDKLNFSVSHQVDCSYRLRRGCERTLYFTDNFNPPRYYNIDKPYNFQDATGKFAGNLFKLFKTYSKIPAFQDIEIIEEGILPAGSYNIGVQYIDSDLNSTEWMTVSDTIIIYNDSLSKTYSEIRGSTNAKNSYQDFGPTNKAIRVTLSNLDTDFPFYRLALIEASNGSGRVSKVTATQELPIKNSVFTFSGNNTPNVLTEEEVRAFSTSIEKVAHVEQLENRLLLANVKGKDVDWWKLQKYASKIQTDAILKTIPLDKMVDNNPKNGLLHTQDVGYMPGEIYSLGIVYTFEDGSTSPVFHIPGKNPARGDSYQFISSGVNPLIKPMRATENSSPSATYTSLTDKCDNKDYWGKDEMGAVLTDTTPVRHHRFPLRSQLGIPLYTKTKVEGKAYLAVRIEGTNPVGGVNEDVVITIHMAGPPNTSYSETIRVDTRGYADGAVLSKDFSTKLLDVHSSSGWVYGSIVPSTSTPAGFTYTPGFKTTSPTYEYTTQILGLNFSNITPPTLEDTNGHVITGYYIVRNERTEDKKTILDTGVLTPTVKDTGQKFISSGLLMPNGVPVPNLVKNVASLINPEFKFNKKEYKNFTILKEGDYTLSTDYDSYPPTVSVNPYLEGLITDDVQPGTSYDPAISARREKDTDGFDLKTLSRINTLDYTLGAAAMPTTKEVFYLNAVSSKTTTDTNSKVYDIFNIACDNAVGVISLNGEIAYTDAVKKLPYVVLKSNLTDFYSTFRTLPYYLQTELKDFSTTTCQVFAGDSYVSSMKYTNTMFYDMQIKNRGTKKGTWKIILGVLGAIAGAALIATGVGAAAGVALTGLVVAGLAVTLGAAGLETEAMGKAYQDAYNEGLDDCVEDVDTKGTVISGVTYFGAHGVTPPVNDDAICWFSDTLSDLWFESSVNMNWRMGSTVGLTDFLATPSIVKVETLNQYLLNKLTVLDTERNNGRLYKGYAGAEIYDINPDYTRRNKQRVYHTLGLEYDCCSKCSEEFPHRIMYSEQSFQEELTDNFRVFLPNNYKDIDGETGVITNLFKIQNSLFVHTEEGLWNLPKNYQERVTNQIVSFLGTGSYFEIPPQKIVDDASGNSAGTVHKWGTLKTQHGYFFVCEKQNCFYKFDGQKLVPITDNGIKNEIYYKIPIQVGSQYDTPRVYFNDDNPSNPIGTGYVLAYDSKKERVLFTKKDFVLSAATVGNGDFEIIYYAGQVLKFSDYLTTINTKALAGFDYYGIIDGKMVFSDGTTVDGIPCVDYILYDKSWTLSFSLKTQGWTSWHSYRPNMYLSTSQNFFSWIPRDANNGFWKHNTFGKYQNFYGIKEPFIIEFVSKGNPLTNKVWDSLQLIAEVKEFRAATQSFYDVSDIFFNKGVFYNSRQCSGEVDIVVKNNSADNYYANQVSDNDLSKVIVDRNERDWSLNSLRDFRKIYTEPIFKSDDASVKSERFIDKVVNYGTNNSILGFDKDWTELESFRDKYLVIRLIFDNFDNYKLLLNYSIENETQSFR